MKRHVVLAALAVAASVGGCAVTDESALPPVIGSGEVPPPLVATPFNEADIAWSKAPGSNSVTGSALLRTVGGDVKTCAGLPVRLTPESPYSRERAARAYNGIDGGINRSARPPSEDLKLAAYVRETLCDAQGAFSFEHLPDGVYYVEAQVTWQVPEVTSYGSYMSNQGGWILRRVEVRGGTVQKIVVTA